jgi:hypothetical protein
MQVPAIIFLRRATPEGLTTTCLSWTIELWPTEEQAGGLRKLRMPLQFSANEVPAAAGGKARPSHEIMSKKNIHGAGSSADQA